MKAPERYWQLLRLTMQGQRRVEELPPCRHCLETHCLKTQPLGAEAVPSDAVVQRQLQTLMQTAEEMVSVLAEGCLRCYISYEIDRTCRDLFSRFGTSAGIPALEELLALVLMDTDPLRQRPTTLPLPDDPTPAGKVLRTFDPDKAQLNTWTKRVVMSDSNLNYYLHDHGIYLDSDWSLLNSLSEKKLRQLLSSDRQLSAGQLQQATAILQSYHAVYRRDRIATRAENRSSAKNRSRCEPPTPDQLERMVTQLQQDWHGRADGWQADRMTADLILTQLVSWAQLMRRSRRPPTLSLDSPEHHQLADTAQNHGNHGDDAESDQQQFLQAYRQALLAAMDEAIALTLTHRVTRLNQRRQPPKAAEFLEGLHRLVCRKESMGAIAPHLGLTAQYQVTRLLNLKALRADIRREVQHHLRHRIGQLAQDYVEVSTMDQTLDHVLDAALDAELERIIGEAETESFNSHGTSHSLLSQRLCHYLNRRSAPL
ncbi:MAG: hypothetical protein EA367_21095 [Leptolyngbya sp. DLM2.Bin15]|nr:MAG: hypothetical protein EA367_21095 [Leptolyngbya sp. DLM2.Bin15]